MNAGTDPTRSVVTRFAPSPTGHLHLGHAHAALFAWRLAQAAEGRFIVRIEDIDPGRCRPAFEEAIFEDLAWLGLDWERPVMRQSERLGAYADALDRLERAGLLYPCFCTRADIAAEIDRAGAAAHLRGQGPNGPVYPGICRALSDEARAERIAAGAAHALRLDMEKAVAMAGPLLWHDRGRGEQAARPEAFGDVVLARKDIAASYHLAVAVDDAAQGVSLVTRGDDLFATTHIHRLLQALLGLDVPQWHHMPLLTNDEGVRLSKRDRAHTLRAMRDAGADPDQIRAEAFRQFDRDRPAGRHSAPAAGPRGSG